jgi:N-methylhydantoinase A/oxoprolinase/acetone carboxylase beta subunit
MVVKGDGSLVSDAVALTSPVETILSGPAASVVGACYLSGKSDLVVSDIGGTTTDIAFLEAGRPALDSEGARVAGWRTMVEAVRVHTYGLGGDSEIALQEPQSGRHRGQGPGYRVGPRRIVPLAILARDHSGLLDKLRQQAAERDTLESHGRFALRLRPRDSAQLAPMEEKLWEALADGPRALSDLAPLPSQQRPLQRLVARGLAIYGGFTPTDACHVLGFQREGLKEAAVLGAEIMAHQAQVRFGGQAPGAEQLAESCIEALYRRSGTLHVESALAESGELPLEARDGPGRRLVALGLAPEKQGLLRLDFALDRPLVAIGASAGTYYPEIARRLGAELLVPEHAEVCNALGAVVGGVFQQVRILVTKPGEGTYRAHLATGPQDFADLASAREAAEAEARQRARQQAEEAGARDIQVSLAVEVNKADLAGGQEMFFELAVLAQALGRPRQTAA